MFLLVADVVLGASNDTSLLDTLDSLVHTNAREDGVGREALPVAAASRVSANGSNGRTKLYIDTLLAVLNTHVVATEVEQLAIPCCGNCHASRESGNEVGEADTQRRVLQTEGFESESRNGTGVADALLALPTNASGQVDFLEKSELGNKLPGLSVGILPVTETLTPRRRVAGWRCLARDCARVVEGVWGAGVGPVLSESEWKRRQEGRRA